MSAGIWFAAGVFSTLLAFVITVAVFLWRGWAQIERDPFDQPLLFPEPSTLPSSGCQFDHARCDGETCITPVKCDRTWQTLPGMAGLHPPCRPIEMIEYRRGI